MANYLYSYISSIAFNSIWWELDEVRRMEYLDRTMQDLLRFKEDLEKLKIYRSLRMDTDIIIWLLAKSSNSIASINESIKEKLGRFIAKVHSFLSIYEPSPYFNEQLKQPKETGKRYFVAYPMKRDPEWFLMDEENRKKILEEHIRIARTHPEGKDIISYTTYSFGIDDQEYVVIYELDSLVNWSHVVAKLREAKHRKWIIKEEPILVGEVFKILI